jgi:hypothetical protein
MALKNQITRTSLRIGILLIIFASLLFNPIPASAMGASDVVALPSFSEFSKAVQDGRADLVRGVYVPNVLAFPVVQQPSESPGFVTRERDQVTQFRMANRYGNVGLLAHNYLSGKTFFELEVGDEVRLIYGDGNVEVFVIAKVLRYQALQPNSVYSAFRDLDTNEALSAEKLFSRVYLGDRHVTFQTCIEKDGELSWGRLFVIAIPKAEYDELHPLNGR